MKKTTRSNRNGLAAKRGRIPQHFIDDVIAGADISGIIGVRLETGLKRRGSEEVGCCPFHASSGASKTLSVNARKNFYHCFSCKASGDALKFLRENDGMTFLQAIEYLAALRGIEVPREPVAGK